MDVIFDIDLVHTAELLELSRISIIRLKYDRILNFDYDQKEIPSATVEQVFDCTKAENYFPIYDVKLSKLSDSALISYAWSNAPEIIKIESKEEILALTKKKETENLFNLDSLQSLLLVPLFIRKDNNKYKPVILGYLILQNYHPRKWQIAELETFKWIAKQVTTAILSQQTLAKVQSVVDERTSQLKISLDVQKKLSNKLRFHLEELRNLNKIKDEFIASLSDALKTPLSNLKIGIKMLNLVNKNESLKKYIDILDDECEKEINLVNNLLALQKLQSNDTEIQRQKINIKLCLDQLCSNFRQELDDRNIKLNLKYKIKYIYTDINSITLILKELIKNGGKFSVSNSTIEINIYKDKQFFYITITTLGAQINEKEQSSIFQPFYQGSNVDNVTNSGTGLGLALVKSLVENLNGKIEVSSLLCANSGHYINTFTLTFPQELHEVSSV